MEREIVRPRHGENGKIEEGEIAKKHHGEKGKAVVKVAAPLRIEVAIGTTQDDTKTTGTIKDGDKFI